MLTLPPTVRYSVMAPGPCRDLQMEVSQGFTPEGHMSYGTKRGSASTPGSKPSQLQLAVGLWAIPATNLLLCPVAGGSKVCSGARIPALWGTAGMISENPESMARLLTHQLPRK
jgi:hypothetical protein